MNMAKKRVKRKKVGDRDAETGQFVSAEYAAAHPAETVAVTVEQPTAQEAQEAYVDAVIRQANLATGEWQLVCPVCDFAFEKNVDVKKECPDCGAKLKLRHG